MYGISREEFKHLNPTKLKPYQEAYKIQQDNIDARNWQLGIYFANSLLSTICNSGLFKKEGSPSHEYPSKPIFSSNSNDEEESNSEANEIQAVLEMQKYIQILNKQNQVR